MSKLCLGEYATLLCDAIRAYDFPAVTVEFDPGGGEIVQKSCHGSMWIVEKRIGRLLRSASQREVKDGLSSVLYWGWAQSPQLGEHRASQFRQEVTSAMLDAFIGLEKDPTPQAPAWCRAESNGSPRPGLLDVNNIGLPGFGMSFTTKILMFLNPAEFPVLDKKIAEVALQCGFPPLSGILTADGAAIRPIGPATAAAYGKWACWCRKIDTLVNETRASPRHDLRAVDVERALFTLADDSDGDDDAATACALLQGPAGWTFDDR